MNPIMAVAVYVILWWLTLFALLPFGAKSFHEAGDAPPAGSEPGAPKVHGLGMKALVAAGIAAILWLGVAWAISADLFHVIQS